MIAFARLRCAPPELSALSASALVIRTGRWNRSARFGRVLRLVNKRATRGSIIFPFNKRYRPVTDTIDCGVENCSTRPQLSFARFGASACGPQESIFFRLSLIRPLQLIAAQEITRQRKSLVHAVVDHHHPGMAGACQQMAASVDRIEAHRDAVLHVAADGVHVAA